MKIDKALLIIIAEIQKYLHLPPYQLSIQLLFHLLFFIAMACPSNAFSPRFPVKDSLVMLSSFLRSGLLLCFAFIHGNIDCKYLQLFSLPSKCEDQILVLLLSSLKLLFLRSCTYSLSRLQSFGIWW